MTISNTLPCGPSKWRICSARRMWPVEETGRNSVMPSTRPITTVLRNSTRSIRSVLESSGARPALFRHASGLGALAPPELELVGGNHAIAPRQAVRQREGLRIRELVGLRLLQGDAAAAAHLRHLVDREDQQLAAFAQRRDRIGALWHDTEGLRLLLVGEVQYLLAVLGLGHDLVLGDDEAAAGIRRHQEPATALHHREIDDVLLVAELDHQADRLAMAARAGELVAAQGVEAAVGAEHQDLVDRLGVHGKARPVAFLVLELACRLVVEMALGGADPAFLGQDHGHRFALDEILDRMFEFGGRIGKLGAAAAERGLAAELLP